MIAGTITIIHLIKYQCQRLFIIIKANPLLSIVLKVVAGTNIYILINNIILITYY